MAYLNKKAIQKKDLYRLNKFYHSQMWSKFGMANMGHETYPSNSVGTFERVGMLLWLSIVFDPSSA